MDNPNVNIVVDVAPIGSCKNKKSIVMMRNIADDPSLVIAKGDSPSQHNGSKAAVCPGFKG
jgi:hypothetical protein